MRRLNLRVNFLMFLFVLGCTPTIVEYGPRVHVVKPGETLQVIAWRYGLDARDLIQWNSLDNPNLIFVDQQLYLIPQNDIRIVSGRMSSQQAAPISAQPILPAPTWLWPVQGPLISDDANSTASKGIGIAGEVGDDVFAAAAGQVVYAGDGLVGYGNLLIIQHNPTFLSAYGHNDRLIVSEGDFVQQGEVIAAMGFGPDRQPQLFFEIRRNGTSVDPLVYLP